MLYLHFCPSCQRIHILSGHRRACPACDCLIKELSVSYYTYIKYDIYQREQLLRECRSPASLSKLELLTEPRPVPPEPP